MNLLKAEILWHNILYTFILSVNSDHTCVKYKLLMLRWHVNKYRCVKHSMKCSVVTLLIIQFSLNLSQLRVYLIWADMTLLIGKFRYPSFICSCTAFQLYPHFPLHLGRWGGLHYVSPCTKKLPFSSRLSMRLKLWWPTHPYFFSVWKMGMIKVQRKSFPFSLFIFTICAHYLLSTVLAVIIIYIFE